MDLESLERGMRVSLVGPGSVLQGYDFDDVRALAHFVGVSPFWYTAPSTTPVPVIARITGWPLGAGSFSTRPVPWNPRAPWVRFAVNDFDLHWLGNMTEFDRETELTGRLAEVRWKCEQFLDDPAYIIGLSAFDYLVMHEQRLTSRPILDLVRGESSDPGLGQCLTSELSANNGSRARAGKRAGRQRPPFTPLFVALREELVRDLPYDISVDNTPSSLDIVGWGVPSGYSSYIGVRPNVSHSIPSDMSRPDAPPVGDWRYEAQNWSLFRLYPSGGVASSSGSNQAQSRHQWLNLPSGYPRGHTVESPAASASSVTDAQDIGPPPYTRTIPVSSSPIPLAEEVSSSTSTTTATLFGSDDDEDGWYAPMDIITEGSPLSSTSTRRPSSATSSLVSRGVSSRVSPPFSPLLETGSPGHIASVDLPGARRSLRVFTSTSTTSTSRPFSPQATLRLRDFRSEYREDLRELVRCERRRAFLRRQPPSHAIFRELGRVGDDLEYHRMEVASFSSPTVQRVRNLTGFYIPSRRADGGSSPRSSPPDSSREDPSEEESPSSGSSSDADVPESSSIASSTPLSSSIDPRMETEDLEHALEVTSTSTLPPTSTIPVLATRVVSASPISTLGLTASSFALPLLSRTWSPLAWSPSSHRSRLLLRRQLFRPPSHVVAGLGGMVSEVSLQSATSSTSTPLPGSTPSAAPSTGSVTSRWSSTVSSPAAPSTPPFTDGVMTVFPRMTSPFAAPGLGSSSSAPTLTTSFSASEAPLEAPPSGLGGEDVLPSQEDITGGDPLDTDEDAFLLSGGGDQSEGLDDYEVGELEWSSSSSASTTTTSPPASSTPRLSVGIVPSFSSQGTVRFRESEVSGVETVGSASPKRRRFCLRRRQGRTEASTASEGTDSYPSSASGSPVVVIPPPPTTPTELAALLSTSFDLSLENSPLWREPFRQRFSVGIHSSSSSTSSPAPVSSSSFTSTAAPSASSSLEGRAEVRLPCLDDEGDVEPDDFFEASLDDGEDDSDSPWEASDSAASEGEDLLLRGRHTRPRVVPPAEVGPEGAGSLSPPLQSPSRILLQDYPSSDWGIPSWGNATTFSPSGYSLLGNASLAVPREHPPRLGYTYTQLVVILLQRGPSTVSSYPSQWDRQFASALEGLEEYRSRPPARGFLYEARRNDSLPVDVWSLGTIFGSTRPWSFIPRGASSEWFARAPSSFPGRGCVACVARMSNLANVLLQSQGQWDADVEARLRLNAGGNAVPNIEYSNRRGLLRLETGSHSCRLGGTVPFPRICFVRQNRGPRLEDNPGGSLIRLRVTYHLGIPGDLPFHWEARTCVRMVFPLFGRLREFWGRALEVFGEVTFSRRTDASGAGVQVSHNLRLRAVLTTPGVLRYAPLDGVTTYVTGARPDVFVMGAALQWISAERPSPGRLPMFPEPLPTSSTELRQSLLRPDVPSSLLHLVNGTWVLSSPDGPTSADSASSHGFLGS